jgi:hypothetical protein
MFFISHIAVELQQFISGIKSNFLDQEQDEKLVNTNEIKDDVFIFEFRY